MTDSGGSLRGLSAVKLALMAKQARTQLGAIARAEPIAVIGMGCRFPGGANSPAQFWQLLCDGTDAVGEIPPTRWDVDESFDDDPAVPGKSTVRQGGFLDGIDQFDAPFFGILRREAEKMDPQQRIFLEVAIEALEHAGQTRESLAGSPTGVFVASYYNDYTTLQLADRDAIDARTLTGTLHSVLANRVSYLLDLRGPSLSIDTACSSSLVAVHLACQSLRAGESRVALAGGVSLMISPEQMIVLSKVGFISPTGRCRTFDADADGFIRGEGCGAIVLKRLSDALTDGDRIFSVIRGTAVNQDGHSTVLAAPNGLAQQALLRDALENAQLSPDRIGFVETHGTATPLGDPIEVEALAAMFGAPRSDGSRCYLGSVKANIGHLEAAAGIAGLIKATLVLLHGEIPRQVHFTRLNRHLSLDGTCLAIADRHLSWPRANSPRVAGVSGFGVGGTNAHVLLEEAPAFPSEAAATPDHHVLLPLSSQSPAALHALATRWIRFLGATPAALPTVCATAASRRSHYTYRAAFVADSAAALVSQLQAFTADAPQASASSHHATASTGAVAFVFSGQGPQWPRMGAELAAREPVFRDTLADIDTRFRAHSGWSLLDAVMQTPETTRLQETKVAQPAIFALQVALAALWESWGVRPSAVVGHSVGEIAALHVAGVLSRDEAVRIVYHRARIMQRATGHGRMASVGLTAEDARRLVDDIGPALSLAAMNAPRSTVLAGTPEALDAAIAVLSSRGVQHRMLPVTYAFHSAQMTSLQAELVDVLGRVAVEPARIAVYSTVTGARIEHTQIDGAYFGRNVRQTVLFAPAITALLESPVDAFVEVSPHPVLAASIAECVGDRSPMPVLVASMRRERSERETLLQACAGLYAAGCSLAWQAVLPLAEPPVDLPSYPWQHERYWLRDGLPAARPRAGRTAHGSALLGDVAPGADSGSVTFEATWPSAALHWLTNHRIAGQIVVPAAAMLEIMRSAASEVASSPRLTLTDFIVHEPLVLSTGPTSGTAWSVTVIPDEGTWRIELRAPLEPSVDATRCIASARAIRGDGSVPPPDDSGITGHWQQDRDALYGRFASVGVEFGPAFRTIDLWRLDTDAAEAWLVLQRDAVVADSGIQAHPTLLDGALQLCVAAITTVDGALPGTILVPLGVEAFTVWRDVPDRIRAVVRINRHASSGAVSSDVQLLADNGAVVATVTGARFAPVDAAAMAAIASASGDLHEIRWRRLAPARNVAPNAAAGRWLVLTNAGSFGQSLVSDLTGSGGTVVTVRPGATTARTTADNGDESWTVCAGDASALTTILASLTTSRTPVRGIVHALSIQPGIDANSDGDAEWLVTGSALQLIQALARDPVTGAAAWFVTQGAQAADVSVVHAEQAPLWGLVAVAALELPELRCHAVDVDASDCDASALMRELLRDEDTRERIALRGDDRYVSGIHRYGASQQQSTIPHDARLVRPESGTLEALRWIASPVEEPGPDAVRLRIHATGVNFRDVLVSLGMYPGSDAPLGAECAGTVEAVGALVRDLQIGDRVFGLCQGSMATSVVVPAAFVARIPADMSDAQAAALPVAFLTAMFGLHRLAGIGAGSRVLIHAATGGVGLAAVQLVLAAGGEVYATAGSPAKRAYLRGLGVEHVFDSRSVSFADEVIAATDGRGVDVVLNSLAGEFIPASVRVIATGGWMLELGKRDVWTPAQMSSARPDIRYRIYDLGGEAIQDPTMVRPMLERVLASLANRVLTPLPVRTFGFGDVTSAFRFMAQARHIGKLVLRAPERATSDRNATAMVRPDATYMITGGTGAIGVRTARWLVMSGARTVVLTGRRALGPDAQEIVAECRAAGAEIHVRSVDASNPAAMRALLSEIASGMPPLRGVVHAAGVVDDGVLIGYSQERWRLVQQGKARGAQLLDELTQDSPLDFFVLYSAAGLYLGAVGQGPYAAANAALDALASSRRGRGLPALSVSWGPWPDAGMAMTVIGRGADYWHERGLGWVEPTRAFAQLEQLLRDGATHAIVAPINWERLLRRIPSGADRDFFRAVTPMPRTRAVTSAAASTAAASTVDTWRLAPSSQWPELVQQHVAERTRLVLGVDESFVIPPATALKDVGLDSLMAVELRNVLTRSTGKSLPATLLFDYPSLDALTAFLLKTFDLLAEPAPAVTPSVLTVSSAAVAALSDEDAEAMLLAELNSLSGPGRP